MCRIIRQAGRESSLLERRLSPFFLHLFFACPPAATDTMLDSNSDKAVRTTTAGVLDEKHEVRLANGTAMMALFLC